MKTMTDRRRLFSIGIVLLIIAFVSCLCTIKQLSSFKQQWHAKNYQWISQQEISCEKEKQGCNQLHLIKGDACYRLAKAGIEPEKNYQLAAKHLWLGIQMTEQWEMKKIDLDRSQTFINLCESFRLLQDLQAGEQASETGQNFLQVSELFFQQEPENPAAVFFFNKARFRQIQSDINRGENSQVICEKLNAMLSAIAQVLPQAQGSQYEEHLLLLRADILTTKASLEGCE
jgi:hypothetical protein